MNIVFASDVFTGVTRRGFLLRGILVVLLGILIALKPLLNLGIITMIAGWFFTLAGVWVLFGAAVKRERRFFCFLAGEKNAVLRGIFPAGYLQMRPNAGIIYRVYPKADGPGRAAF